MTQVVRYADLSGDIAVGLSARLIPVNHPDAWLNGRWVWTSRVVVIESPAMDGPVFSTLNTLYMPADTGIDLDCELASLVSEQVP